MMQLERLLEDILEHPQDDASRLIYADWLDEHCPPRAEFIRVQCRLARLPANHVCMFELERRERELLAEYEAEWVEDIADMVDWWTFERGFVEEIGASADRFLLHACSLFQRAPIQKIHLRGTRDRIEALAASPFLQRVSYLDLSNNPVRDHGARCLANSRYLARVQGLNLSSSGIGDAGLKALGASPHLAEVRELYLGDNYISNTGVRAFAQSGLASQLQLLHLRFNTISADGAEVLHQRLGERVCF
jgi:uncharacterized protein (TIGR02996 family)